MRIRCCIVSQSVAGSVIVLVMASTQFWPYEGRPITSRELLLTYLISNDLPRDLALRGAWASSFVGTLIPFPDGSFRQRRKRKPALEQRLRPVFERFLHFMQELVRNSAIHNTMVVAQGNVAHRTDGNGVIHNHRALLDRA